MTATYVAAAAIATVTGSTPSTLTRNPPAKITVTGVNFPDTVVFAISNVVCNGDYIRTSMSVSQTCTAQIGTPASVGLTVKDMSGGKFLVNGNLTYFITVK